MSVYIVQAGGDGGPVKIGRSDGNLKNKGARQFDLQPPKWWSWWMEAFFRVWFLFDWR